MNELQVLATEVSLLRGQVAAMHRAHTSARMRHGWLRPILHDLEYNPHTQYRVHIGAAYFWIVSAVPILVFFFGWPDQWLQYGVLITLIYSLYANFATDYGAASAALAAGGGTPLPEIPTERKP